MPHISIVFAIILPYVAAVAVADVRKHRISNYFTVPCALLGFLFHGFLGEGILFSLLGFGVGFILLLLPWLLGGGGMGDVKLLASLGAWLGAYNMLIMFAFAVLLSAIGAIGILVYDACTKGLAETKRRYLQRRPQPRQQRKRGEKPIRVLPFAVPVAIATITVLAYYLQKAA